ncbi:MAG: hypothetical protein WCD81_03020 [Candidatus Bathyarchaeia archaeon]
MSEKELTHWHKLAEISLNTSSTMFAIVFAILFGLWSNVGKLSGGFKFGFFIVAITFVIEAPLCILSLYGRKKEVLSYVSLLAKWSVIGLFLMILEMVVLLSALLTM